MTIYKVICKVQRQMRVFYASSYMGAGMIADLFDDIVGIERIDDVRDAYAHDRLTDSFWALVAHFRKNSDWSDIKEICDRATGYGRPDWCHSESC